MFRYSVLNILLGLHDDYRKAPFFAKFFIKRAIKIWQQQLKDIRVEKYAINTK